MIYMIIAGYFEDDTSDELTNDPVLNHILTDVDSEQKCMISFRSGYITESDLESFTIITKIVLNQFEMDKIARL